MTRRFSHLAVVVWALACATPQTARVAPVSAATTTIVVVRHAEKSTDDPRDPSLSAAGQQRATALISALKDAGVTDIYTTQYKRTRQTAEPLAKQFGISIAERPINGANAATYAQDLAREILTRSTGKWVLVVGHSNTVPDIVRALSGSPVPPITDAEYDHVFIVTIPASGSPRLMQLRFGRPEPWAYGTGRRQFDDLLDGDDIHCAWMPCTDRRRGFHRLGPPPNVCGPDEGSLDGGR